MFCFQCQETAKNTGCTVKGVCGKPEDTANLQDLLIYALRGLAVYGEKAKELGISDKEGGLFVAQALFATITNANFDNDRIIELIKEALNRRETLKEKYLTSYKEKNGRDFDEPVHHSAVWFSNDMAEFKEFESFNGPILMTTNCIIPMKKNNTYQDRIFTTGMTGFPGVKHIADRPQGGPKDFSEIIELAKKCSPPEEIETGKIVAGFAHNQVLALADKVVDAVKSGVIKRFVVMAGCDGRQKSRSYFTEVAEALPQDAVILTAGCAKYRYNKLDLGDIGGIPRILDAGQCNDSYSLAVIALKLKEVFELDDINDLPISFDIGWYEQKAVAVLLALLHLGVKGIRLGPTLPAFLSPTVVKVLVENFDIKPTGEVQADVDAMMAAA